jgi:hypothetical protein
VEATCNCIWQTEFTVYHNSCCGIFSHCEEEVVKGCGDIECFKGLSNVVVFDFVLGFLLVQADNDSVLAYFFSPINDGLSQSNLVLNLSARYPA